MNKLYISAVLLLSTTTAQAQAQANILSGEITAANEISSFSFKVTSDNSAASFWTESGLNSFSELTDTNMAVWERTNDLSDWILVGSNDDANGAFGSSNGLDSGLSFANLASGNYLVTITNSMNNPFDSLLSTGFNGNGLNNPNNIGKFELHFDGNVVMAVSEPEEWAMMMLGLPLMGFVARRRKAA